jgi:hypothetical protein
MNCKCATEQNVNGVQKNIDDFVKYMGQSQLSLGLQS